MGAKCHRPGRPREVPLVRFRHHTLTSRHAASTLHATCPPSRFCCHVLHWTARSRGVHTCLTVLRHHGACIAGTRRRSRTTAWPWTCSSVIWTWIDPHRHSYVITRMASEHCAHVAMLQPNCSSAAVMQYMPPQRHSCVYSACSGRTSVTTS